MKLLAILQIILIKLILLEVAFSQTISPPCSCLNVKPNFGTNSNIPQQLCVPSLAYDQTSIWLTWNKPDNYENIVDFNIYMNGKKIGNSKTNAAINTLSGPYIQNFYKNDLNNFHTKILFTTYLVKGLNPNTIYTFIVRAVDSNGAESGNSNQIVAKTANNYEKIVDITTVGAIGDGTTLNTQTIQKAIDLCSNSTSPFGCKVLIPKGIFLSGPLFLRSQMTFELANGAILRATSNAAKYPLQYGSTPSAFFNAYAINNIRVVGPGTIDGNGWKLASNATDEFGKQIPVYPKGSFNTFKNLGNLAANQIMANGNNYVSRSRLFAINSVSNLYIGGAITFLNPSMTTLGFGDSKNVSIINVRFQTYNINNGDGIDIGRSSNIQIIGSFFDTGDDCIAIGTGCGINAGQSPPVQCILIKNNYFRHGHGAPSFGSNTGDWVKDVLIEDNIAFLTDNGIRLKSSPQCGGGVQNVYVRDIAMLSVGSRNNFTFGGQQFSGDTTSGHPFVFMLNYRTTSIGNAKIPTQFSNITCTRISIDNVKPTKCGSFIYLIGHDGGGIYQTKFSNIKVTNAAPAQISLADTVVFNNVDFTNYGPNNAWSINKAENVKFINVPTMKLNKLNYA
uniref:Fibronectin type-III domain-containing protein n=1 Tax=Meloidogyne hapla TaxID=6305 RepID=A0A1I8B6W1_MELHA